MSPPSLSSSASASTNASAASATTAAAGTAHESVRSFCASNDVFVARSTEGSGRASVDELAQRVGDAQTRPLLAGKDVRAEIERLLSARQKFYERAHVSIDTTGLVPSQVARRITEALEQA